MKIEKKKKKHKLVGDYCKEYKRSSKKNFELKEKKGIFATMEQ